MSNDEAFIRAVLAAPADVAPLLVYADWLEERNDPRADLIRAWRRFDEAGDRFTVALTEGNASEQESEFSTAAAIFALRAWFIDREWLFRLGLAHPWVSQRAALAVARMWAVQRDYPWQHLAPAGGTQHPRAWAFGFADTPGGLTDEVEFAVHNILGRSGATPGGDLAGFVGDIEGSHGSHGL